MDCRTCSAGVDYVDDPIKSRNRLEKPVRLSPRRARGLVGYLQVDVSSITRRLHDPMGCVIVHALDQEMT